MGDLQRDFSAHEFACPCGCGTVNIAFEAVRKWQVVRDFMERLVQRDLKLSAEEAHKFCRMVVASGCRCHKKNIEVGGADDSSHLADMFKDCTATDWVSQGSVWNHFFMEACVMTGVNRKGFGEIGEVTVIHTDVDKSKDQFVMWAY